MKIAIIGAAAGVGLQATRYALARDHQVVALSRHVDDLPAHPNLTKLTGDATQAADLRQAIAGVDAIVVTLGTGKRTKPTSLCEDFANALLKALREAHMDVPVIVLSAFGVAGSAPYYGFIPRTFVRLMLKGLFEDKARMEQKIAAACPRWSIVRPGILTDGPMTKTYRVEGQLRQGMKIGKVSRSDVAHFLVSQAEQPTYLGQYPSLTG